MTTNGDASRRHVFITVEGLSGSGKTTTATALAKALDGYYYKTPPELFAAIRPAVDAGATPLARYLYYLAGIAQASADIREILNRCPVVCDKYLPTVLAYSRAGGSASYVDCGDAILRPDFSFLLDVPDDVRWRRILERGPVSETHRAFLQMELDLKVIDQFRQMKLPTIDNGSEQPAPAHEQIVARVRAAKAKAETP